jgi:hypothetical protein
MKKPEKLPQLSSEHKEALALLGARPEFKALEKLFRIEESNIIIQSFKVQSSDPELMRKKSWHEGRLYQLRKILGTFSEAKKGEE